MSATQHCPRCAGSTFRKVDGTGNQYVICECTMSDLEDTPRQAGFQEGFLAGYKSGCEDGKASLAAEIVSLRSRISELEKALEPFARMCARNVKPAQRDTDGCEIVMSVREMRLARSVLLQGDRTAPASDGRELESNG